VKEVTVHELCNPLKFGKGVEIWEGRTRGELSNYTLSNSTHSVEELLVVNRRPLEIILLSAPYSTHSYSQGQRMLRLKLAAAVRVAANRHSVAVTNGNIAPAAYYMLFTVTQGISGNAAWIQATN